MHRSCSREPSRLSKTTPGCPDQEKKELSSITLKVAFLALALAALVACLPGAQALSYPLCEEGGAVWVTERPSTGPTFPGANFWCESRRPGGTPRPPLARGRRRVALANSTAAAAGRRRPADRPANPCSRPPFLPRRLL